MVVRMRVNRSKTGKRRSHHGLTSARLTKDAAGVHLRHRVDSETGMYRGKVVIDVVARTKREQRRIKRKQKELRASGQDAGETKKKETAETK